MTPQKDTDNETLMRISEAAQAAGVSKNTVEYYLLVGLIYPRRKPGSRGRWFDESLVRRIRLIRELNQSGYTLRDIREIYLSEHPD